MTTIADLDFIIDIIHSLTLDETWNTSCGELFLWHKMPRCQKPPNVKECSESHIPVQDGLRNYKLPCEVSKIN